MARKKDVDIKTKRIRTILLNKPAFLKYRKIKTLRPKWNFTDFVNRQLLLFGTPGDDWDILKTELIVLQEEREKADKEFEAKIQAIVERMETVPRPNYKEVEEWD